MTNKEKYHILCDAQESIPIFSRDWWLDVVCGEDHWDVLLVEENDRILATLPIFIPFSSVVSMPPYTQTLGPWFLPEADDTKYTTIIGRKQALCKQLIDQLKSYSCFFQNFDHSVTDWLPFYWEGYRQTTRYTYLLNDIHDFNTLSEQMSSNIRRNITKAKEKNKIEIKRGLSEKEFVEVYKKTFERQNKKAPHIAVLNRLIKACQERNQGDLWGGYDQEGRLHAAAFIVWQNSCAYYLAGGGDPTLRESGAHSLVLWEAIKAMTEYTDQFDFEGSMLPGVERFFREFGAKQTPFFTISKGNVSLILRAWQKIRKIV